MRARHRMVVHWSFKSEVIRTGVLLTCVWNALQCAAMRQLRCTGRHQGGAANKTNGLATSHSAEPGSVRRAQTRGCEAGRAPPECGRRRAWRSTNNLGGRWMNCVRGGFWKIQRG